MPDVDSTPEFRSIPDFDCYRISKVGRIQTERKPGGGKMPWRDMKSHLNDSGYYQVRLKRNDGENKLMRLHRVVLMAWVGPCSDDRHACHRDGNKTNNHVDNLYWGTRLDNKADEIRAGDHAYGERHGMSKLTEADIHEIRYLYANGWLQREIAVKLNVSRMCINSVLTGRNWKHVTSEAIA